MNCKKYIDLLPLYVTGDLTKGDIDDVRHHLEICDTCKEDVKKLPPAMK